MPFDGLNDDQIRSAAPSVFATHPSPGVSEKYAYLPSYQVVRSMRSLGFEAVKVREGTKRDANGRAFALHEIRFRKVGLDWADQTKTLGGITPEAIFRNSHDRSSPASLRAGLSRLVCLNGMTVSEADMRFSVRHVGKTVQDSFHGAVQAITAQFGRVVEVAQSWQEIDLSLDQVRAFAQEAVAARGTTIVLEPETVLMARREIDCTCSLWSAFNKAQENLTQGSLQGRSAKGAFRSVPSIKSLAVDAAFNDKLWAIASRFAETVQPGRASVVGR